MEHIWPTISSLLEQKWWQGFAGIAQICAAILTLFAFFQARKILKQADEARRDSAAPDWDIVSESVVTHIHPQNYYTVDGQIGLQNTGFGPARNVSMEFLSLNGNNPTLLQPSGFIGSGKTVLPDSRINVQFRWNITEPPIGSILIHCSDRLGNPVTKVLKITTYHGGVSDLGNWSIEWDDSFQSSLIKRVLRWFNRKQYHAHATLGSTVPIENYYKLERWMQDNFDIVDDGTPGGTIILDSRTDVKADGAKVTVQSGMSVRGFVIRFGSVNTPPTATELKNVAPTDITWHRRFDDWVEKGIIDP